LGAVLAKSEAEVATDVDPYLNWTGTPVNYGPSGNTGEGMTISRRGNDPTLCASVSKTRGGLLAIDSLSPGCSFAEAIAIP
jgi:hypothetical protein